MNDKNAKIKRVTKNIAKAIMDEKKVSNIPVNSRIETDFANTGTVTAMTNDDWNNGLGGSVAVSKLNYLFGMFSECIKEVQQQGLLAWNTNTTYGIGSFVSLNGNLWKSLVVNNKGVSPVEGANWTQFKGGGASAVLSVTGDTDVVANPTTGAVKLSLGSNVAHITDITKDAVGLSAVKNVDCTDADNVVTGETNQILTKTEVTALAKETEIEGLTAHKVTSPINTTVGLVPKWHDTVAGVGNEKTLDDGFAVGSEANNLAQVGESGQLPTKIIPAIPISDSRTFEFDFGTDDTAIWTYIKANWTAHGHAEPTGGSTAFVLMAESAGATKYLLHEIWTFTAKGDWTVKENWIERVIEDNIVYSWIGHTHVIDATTVNTEVEKLVCFTTLNGQVGAMDTDVKLNTAQRANATKFAGKAFADDGMKVGSIIGSKDGATWVSRNDLFLITNN